MYLVKSTKETPSVFCIYQYIESPMGDWLLGANVKGISYLSHSKIVNLSDFISLKLFQTSKDMTISELENIFDHLTLASNQLSQYFSRKLQAFNLPLDLQGTVFQKQIWHALSAIPYGRTCSYQDIAIQIGNAKASRAVGAANGKNPVSIIIPCHRVIGKSGKLTGYANGLEIKDLLLNLEKMPIA